MQNQHAAWLRYGILIIFLLLLLGMLPPGEYLFFFSEPHVFFNKNKFAILCFWILKYNIIFSSQIQIHSPNDLLSITFSPYACLELPPGGPDWPHLYPFLRYIKLCFFFSYQLFYNVLEICYLELTDLTHFIPIN